MPDRTSRKFLVVSLGDSFLFGGKDLDVEGIRSLSKALLRLIAKGFRVVAVAGSGSLGEEYSRVARDSGASRIELNQILVRASRLNAQLLIESLRSLGVRTSTKPLLVLDNIREFFSKFRGPRGSTAEGRTGAVAVLGNPFGKNANRYAAKVALEFRGRLIILSSKDDIEKLPR